MDSKLCCMLYILRQETFVCLLMTCFCSCLFYSLNLFLTCSARCRVYFASCCCVSNSRHHNTKETWNYFHHFKTLQQCSTNSSLGQQLNCLQKNKNISEILKKIIKLLIHSIISERIWQRHHYYGDLFGFGRGRHFYSLCYHGAMLQVRDACDTKYLEYNTITSLYLISI